MTAGSPNLVIRADGDARIGTGHVMRCLALGQAWQDAGGGVVFLTAPGTEALESRLGREGFEIHHVRAAPGSAEDGAETVRMSDACGAEWMVVDGYHFGPDYLQAVKGGNHGLLVVDDKGQTGACAANLVLNQNLHADEGLYGDRRAETRLLLGLDHVMLRREFRRRIGHRPNVAEVARKILVTLGGADRGNHTGLVMRALELAQTPGLEATVVVGPSNPNKEPLKALASAMSYPISFAFDIENMADLMAGVDLAICTGGATVWELAYMGVPALVGISADVEQRLVEGLMKVGLYAHLGRFERAEVAEVAKSVDDVCGNAEVRRRMSRLGQDLVDGRGVERILEAMGQVRRGQEGAA